MSNRSRERAMWIFTRRFGGGVRIVIPPPSEEETPSGRTELHIHISNCNEKEERENKKVVCIVSNDIK